jgi:transposase
MRGHVEAQASMFSYFSPESRVPSEHPLRSIKAYVDELLRGLSRQFAQMYAKGGRPSIPPERLLKATLLMALYSVRSERLFCEALDYNILFRWFLDMNLEEASLDQSNFSRLRTRLVEHDVARRFFDAVVKRAQQDKLLSDEHFTVDGTLIEAWASLKSFRRKDGGDNDPGADGMVDFKGEKRTNATHESTSDPDAKLMRKGLGKEAKLSYAEHVLMENRHGLCVDVIITAASAKETDAACAMLQRQRRKGLRPATVGGDKGYHEQGFIAWLRHRRIIPHVALNAARPTKGVDRRTTRHESYQISQRKRKLVEQIFGWKKTVGGLRKTRVRGMAKNQCQAYLTAAAYNLLRMSRLRPITG